MNSLSRLHLFLEAHETFKLLCRAGVPVTEIVYVLNLSKSQRTKHLAKLLDDRRDWPMPSYEALTVGELPATIVKMLPDVDAPLVKIEACGEGVILTPYTPSILFTESSINAEPNL